MSIKRRIWALPVIATVIFGVGLAVSVYFSTLAISSIKATADVDYPVLDRAKILSSDVQGLTDMLRDAVSEGDKKRIDAVAETAKKVKEKLKKLGDVPGQKALADKLSGEFDAYYAPALKVAKIMLEIEQGDPQAEIGTMQSALKILQADLTKTVDTAQSQFTMGIEKSGDNVRNVLYTAILVALMVTVSLGVVSFFVVRTIWQQLGGEPEYAREIAAAVAAGDLSMEISIDGEHGTSLLSALQEMQVRLQSMVADIKTSAETIKVASSEIASGNADLSSRTESQASSLEETASSMETLTDTVKQNADNARQANQLVQSASGVAVKGGNVVSQVVTTMAEINQSSKKIVDIIAVIDGIAFQTNILALNAAVEAARAGEQGRGFAVVASEVRNLAQRSAAAAKEIKTLIGDSVDKVNIGSQLVDQAGNTMDEIVASVKRVSDIMAEITSASQEQSAGIQEVSVAIGQMDEMTQQNSALVEQAAAAAESLEEQADHLTQALDVFKLSSVAPAYGGKARPASPAVKTKAYQATAIGMD
ncbi:methyl-accepting chemotaxis protein [Undibacterium sp. RTI2.1]|uniref:methyl-accepting chemotaxis protein n=1 Tax=unclassified Undibacterium TaxID=2630295 RepID=UPI002AB53A00|nr:MULTISPECIES: methyl-accepting chemotaxis protein [unclassified Undibacterium]MDY7539431.1 methyl-accepting chemotaxis protein [Undibacterium sp. 5I1]MEB0029651.1 methyl-accepting chemotaxis protein [Undibacterium sp. RTI2.1]MEB0116122.1 methyl-accepting chemotaxis protein [Undibacterium sp. RTI2.2]MEB0231378.1 methyl-accepting chemotaxis protein [Undibacterium sp. 10I3]MEB0258378.1 methyl-accepting chemotaxis protein [Undibacterium sp. 5I1]